MKTRATRLSRCNVTDHVKSGRDLTRDARGTNSLLREIKGFPGFEAHKAKFSAAQI